MENQFSTDYSATVGRILMILSRVGGQCDALNCRAWTPDPKVLPNLRPEESENRSIFWQNFVNREGYMVQKIFFILWVTAAWSWNSCALCNSEPVDRPFNWAKTQGDTQRFFRTTQLPDRSIYPPWSLRWKCQKPQVSILFLVLIDFNNHHCFRRTFRTRWNDQKANVHCSLHSLFV